MLNFFSTPVLIFTVACLIAGMIAGLVIHDTWLKWQERRRRAIPNHWTLDSRALVSSAELKVWQWLRSAFYDHHVMIKTPLARFTRPGDKAHGKQWFEMLNGIYCTFSVCTADGVVIGCLDVPGKMGLRRSHWDMKESILTSCGVAYAVVRANNLPGLEAMRAAFLGEIDLSITEPPVHAREEVDEVEKVHDEFTQELIAVVMTRPAKLAPMVEARTSLQSKLEFARRKRAVGFNPLITYTGIVDDASNPGFRSNWEECSLMASLDSRAALL